MRNKKYKIGLVLAIIVAILALAINYFNHHTVAVLEPRGPIALKEKNLLLLSVEIMLIVAIPVFVLTFLIVYKYREGHKHKYKPEFDHSLLLESIWWLIPTVIIVILGTITWRATYQLNPYTPIASRYKALHIEVVALDWKWLFIYPGQHIASVNSLILPVNRPVTFYITADAPMNSFWIPQLSGQIYAMAGMSTELNLMATSIGTYYGSSANISGNGFAGMNFKTHAESLANFKSWINQAKSSQNTLSWKQYEKLATASTNNPVAYYKDPDPNLYTSVINQYMAPGAQGGSIMEM